MLYILFADSSNAAGRWARVLSRAVALAGGSRDGVAHCAVGDGCIVLEQTRAGPHALDFEMYVLRYPGLVWWVEVQVRGGGDPPDLLQLADPRPPGLLAPIACWLSRGAWLSRDCVQMARATLAWVGHPVPRRVTTPAELLRHLRSEGHYAEPVA